MEILKFSRSNQKKGLQECLWLLKFLKRKLCWGSKTKKSDSKNAYNYQTFLDDVDDKFERCWWSLITMVEERWRSSKMWILARPCDKNEPPMDPSKDDAVRNWYFPGGHSNILKSAESRMWISLQTCDTNEGRRREAKPSSPNELIRFIARTPNWQATVWGIILKRTHSMFTCLKSPFQTRSYSDGQKQQQQMWRAWKPGGPQLESPCLPQAHVSLGYPSGPSIVWRDFERPWLLLFMFISGLSGIPIVSDW